MGTTLTLAFVAWPDAYVAHVGDSRGVLWRDGSVRPLTTDHTVAKVRADLGCDVGDGAEVLWNVLGGASDDLHLDVAHRELRAGDVLLLATDGVSADEDQLARVLGSGRDAEGMVADLVGPRSHDDPTAVVARFLPHAAGPLETESTPTRSLHARSERPRPGVGRTLVPSAPGPARGRSRR